MTCPMICLSWYDMEDQSKVKPAGRVFTDSSSIAAMPSPELKPSAALPLIRTLGNWL